MERGKRLGMMNLMMEQDWSWGRVNDSLVNKWCVVNAVGFHERSCVNGVNDWSVMNDCWCVVDGDNGSGMDDGNAMVIVSVSERLSHSNNTLTL